MKDLIMITAYCPDDTRENILRNLVTSLEKHKNIFDVMIVSHTPIPLDIQKKVDVSLFDKKNEILTDNPFHGLVPNSSESHRRTKVKGLAMAKSTVGSAWC